MSCLQSKDNELTFISIELVFELLKIENENKHYIKLLKNELIRIGIFQEIDNLCLVENKKINELANSITSEFFDKEFIYYEEINNFK